MWKVELKRKRVNMPKRFIFRQIYYQDLAIFLKDGEIRAKNHQAPQKCHQVSYQDIVDRRGTLQFPMPNGRMVNDFVPFYFSPITSFTYTIFRKNVPLISPDGNQLGMACEDQRVFLVSSPEGFRDSEQCTCFSDYALNSMAPMPEVVTDLNTLEEHVHWNMFDESPRVAEIEEIGYQGVCKFFCNTAASNRMQRSSMRMAEFLVYEAVPLDKIVCVVAKTDTIGDQLRTMMHASCWNIPIYTKPGCFFDNGDTN
jgi:hypothetical protein